MGHGPTEEPSGRGLALTPPRPLEGGYRISPADRTARYGALDSDLARTAIVPPAAETWTGSSTWVRARKNGVLHLEGVVVPVRPPPAQCSTLLPGAGQAPFAVAPPFEATHVGAPPPRLASPDGARRTSPAVIPAAATFRPPPPVEVTEPRALLALSAVVFFLGLAAVAGVAAWILARSLAG